MYEYNEQELELKNLMNSIGEKGDRRYSGDTLFRALLRGHIRSVEQLKNTPKEELLKIRNLGDKRITYILNRI